MPKFAVKSPLEYDGKPYRIGSIVEMREDQAEQLVALGRIEPLKGPALVGDKGQRPKS